MADSYKHELSNLQRWIGKLLIKETLKVLEDFHLKNKCNTYIVGSVGKLEPGFIYRKLPNGKLQIIDIISDVDVVLSSSFLMSIKQLKRWTEKTIIRCITGTIFYKGYTKVKITFGFMPLTLLRILGMNSVFIYEFSSLTSVYNKHSSSIFEKHVINYYDILNLIINNAYELVTLLRNCGDKYNVLKALRKMAKIAYGYELYLGFRPRFTQQILEFLSLTNLGEEYSLFKTKEFELAMKGVISYSQLGFLRTTKVLSGINYCLHNFIMKKLIPDLIKEINKDYLLKIRLIILEILRKLLKPDRNLIWSVYSIFRYGLTIDDLIKLEMIYKGLNKVKDTSAL